MSIFDRPGILSDRPPARSWIISWRGAGCRFLMWFLKTVKWARVPKIKVQVPGIWGDGCVFDYCVGLISFNKTTSLMGGESDGILYF